MEDKASNIKKWKQKIVDTTERLREIKKDTYSFEDVLERSALHEERLECQKLIELEVIK